MITSKLIGSRCFSTSICANKAYLNTVTIIGAGHMGTGIALNNCMVGNEVTVADVSRESLDVSKQKIEARLHKISKRQQLKNERGIDEILGKIRWTQDIDLAVGSCDLVVESIPERIQLKHELFSKIDQIAPPKTIFATNTSSLPVWEIAESVSVQRRERFGGTHFFDRDVKLVEVIRLKETSDETYHKLSEWAQFIQKVPIPAKDVPGFIVNRLGIKYLLNAMQMYERGDAEMKDIDLAMKFGAGYPFGPFELADHIGLDVLHDILQGWNKRFPEVEVPKTLSKLYSEGKLGRKTGQGFFKY